MKWHLNTRNPSNKSSSNWFVIGVHTTHLKQKCFFFFFVVKNLGNKSHGIPGKFPGFAQAEALHIMSHSVSVRFELGWGVEKLPHLTT